MTGLSRHFKDLPPNQVLRAMVHALVHWRADMPKAIAKDIATLADSMELPHIAHEDWKGFNIEGFFKGEIFPSTLKLKYTDFDIKLPFDHHTIIIGNGEILFHDLPSSIRIETLSDFYRSDIQNIYSLLNLSMTEKEHRISIAEDEKIDLPIVVYKVSKALERELCSSRVSIALGRRSQANIFYLSSASINEANFSNDSVEISVADNATLNYQFIDHKRSLGFNYLEESITLGKNAICNMTLLHQGGAKSRHQVNCKITGEESYFNLSAATLVTEGRHQDLFVTIEHQASHTRSRQLVKTILNQESNAYFSGKIIIPPNVSQVDAYQSNKNLLLDAKSKVFGRPQLEIKSSDVKCSHGCTTGRLSEEELFYLQARGLSKNQSRRLLLQGFASDIFTGIENLSIRHYLNKLVEL